MKKKAVFLIILAGTLWGTSAIFANLLRPIGFSSLQMVAMRGVVSAIIMSIYVLIKDKSLFKAKLTHIFLFMLGGASTFLTGFLYYEAISICSASVAVMLMYTAPVFVMAFSVLFMGERLNLIKILSIIFMLLGCALISGVVGGVEFNIKGTMFGLASGLSYAIYNIITKVQMNKRCNPLSSSVYCFIFYGLFALMFISVPDFIKTASVNPSYTYPLIFGIGLFTVALPYFLYTIALKHIPVGTASALGIVEPMTATIFGVVFFGDNLTIYSVCGIILILGVVFLLSQSKE